MTQVLVVDDSPQITSWLSLELAALGHRVSSAENGQEALLLMECDAPDVMVLDIDMPLMNGFDVLRKMRRRPNLEGIRVVMLTGRGREANWVQGYRLGVHDYLTKPLEIEDLTAAIERVMTLSPDQLSERREGELERSELLLKLETMFEPAPPPPPEETHYEAAQARSTWAPGPVDPETERFEAPAPARRRFASFVALFRGRRRGPGRAS